MDRDAHEPRLELGTDVRDRRGRQEIGVGLSTREHEHASDAFRDEHAAVIGEGDVPWVLETVLHDLDAHRLERPDEPRDADA